MRTSLSATSLILSAAFCLALAGCGGKPQPAASAADPASPAPATATADAPDAVPAGMALQGDLVASTNEPFWNAQVSDEGLVLRGIEAQRELAIAASDITGDTRTVRATDASGAVELQVTATACQDSMSGAMYPYSAVLAIDGGEPINGCARPASMPPPGEGM
jgi:uncharacterized membrane protein